MGSGGAGSSLALDDLVRRVLSHGRNLHWLVGAGVSASAGVPTAWDMIYDFKRTIYAQAKRVDITDLDLSDPDVQLRLDAFFANQTKYPRPGDPEEYSVFFETVHPDPGSRQRKIQQTLDQAKPAPNLGHVILAVMWQLQMLHVAWTTNFDDVLEQAATVVSGAPRWLRVVDRSEPAQVKTVFEDPTKPVLVKMHGDFESEYLDNTSEELAADNHLRAAISEAMRTKGLVVVGYSGRDASVMAALGKAFEAPRAYPSGLYWVAREGDTLLPAVQALLEQARANGVEAYLVECPSFEELMVSIRYLLPTNEHHKELLDRFQPATRLSEFDIPPRGGRWPRLRLNAIAVATHPNTARLVECEIGGTREVRDAIAAASVRAVAARRRDGVIAFGSDSALLEAFGPWDPKLDYGQLDPTSPSDAGLLYDAIALALERERPLVRQDRRLLSVDPARATDRLFQPLRQAGLSTIVGKIPGTAASWAEAVELRLEERFGSMWLIYAPVVWCEYCGEADEDSRRKEWGRERQVKRYNRPYTALLKAWADVLCGSEKESRLQAIGIATGGSDAIFDLKRLAPFAERRAS